jgi:hypothetical protein
MIIIIYIFFFSGRVGSLDAHVVKQPSKKCSSSLPACFPGCHLPLQIARRPLGRVRADRLWPRKGTTGGGGGGGGRRRCCRRGRLVTPFPSVFLKKESGGGGGGRRCCCCRRGLGTVCVTKNQGFKTVLRWTFVSVFKNDAFLFYIIEDRPRDVVHLRYKNIKTTKTIPNGHNYRVSLQGKYYQGTCS